MIKHVILWTLKEEFKNENVKKEIKKNLEGLKGIIEGLNEIKVEINPLESSNADVMLYSVFESEEALKGYSIHPEHVRVADTFVRPFTKTRACMDYID